MIYLQTLKLLEDVFNEDQSICDELCKITFDNPNFPSNRENRTNRLNDLIEKALEEHDQLENVLKQINDRINEAVQRTAKLENELEELNKNLNELKMKRNESFEITQEQQIYIDVLKYKIKLYKFLMNTHLSYGSLNIKGYIQNKTNWADFDFNKTKLKPEKITAKYFNKLETTTGIDCKRIAANILHL